MKASDELQIREQLKGLDKYVMNTYNCKKVSPTMQDMDFEAGKYGFSGNGLKIIHDYSEGLLRYFEEAKQKEAQFGKELLDGFFSKTIFVSAAIGGVPGALIGTCFDHSGTGAVIGVLAGLALRGWAYLSDFKKKQGSGFKELDRNADILKERTLEKML